MPEVIDTPESQRTWLEAERQRRRAALAPPVGPPIPGAAAPPPGYLAGAVMSPSAPPPGPPIPESTTLGSAAQPPGYLSRNIGGAEMPSGAIAGTPIPTGPSAPLGPGGPISTPVSSPLRPQSPSNGPLDALREQMDAIGKLTGAAPQAPYIQHMIEPGSPTYGLAALGGRMVGNQTPDRTGVDPTAALQASIFHSQDASHGADTKALLERLGIMGSQAIQHGHLGIDAMNAQTNRLRELNAGSTAQTEADRRGAAAFQQSLAASFQANPQWSPAQHYAQAEGQTGMSTARYHQLSGVTPLHQDGAPGSVAIAPAGTPVVATQPGRNAQNISTTPPAGITQRPFAGIERQLDQASGYTPPTPASGNQPATQGGLPTGATPGAFINKLEATNPGMLAENFPAIRNYMINRFGEQATEHAMRLPETASIGQSLGIGLNQLGERFRGSTDEDRGNSVLRNLQRAIRGAGGHDEFLRQQRAANGPTPGAPPLP